MPPALPNGVDELAWAAHRSQNVQKDKKANLDHLLWGKSVAFSNQAQLVNIQCKSIEMSPLLRFLVAFIATFLQETPASNFVDLMWAWKKKFEQRQPSHYTCSCSTHASPKLTENVDHWAIATQLQVVAVAVLALEPVLQSRHRGTVALWPVTTQI